MRNTLWYLAGAVLTTGCADAARPLDESGLAQAVTVSRIIPGHDLGSLGGPGTHSQAADINNAGVVVGVSQNRDGFSRAFRWTRTGGMQDLGTLPGSPRSGATRIVDNGQILGWSEVAEGAVVPVRWNAAGRIERLDIPPVPDSYYSNDVADFSERGEVVGSAIGDAMHGWYWSRVTGTVDLLDEVPSCGEFYAYAINAHGTFSRPLGNSSRSSSSSLSPRHSVQPSQTSPKRRPRSPLPACPPLLLKCPPPSPCPLLAAACRSSALGSVPSVVTQPSACTMPGVLRAARSRTSALSFSTSTTARWSEQTLMGS